MAGEAYNWHWLMEWVTPNTAHMHAVERVIYHGRSKYQEILVAEFKDLGRALVLDGKTQSSLLDEFVYHEALVHPAMILHGTPRSVLILGGGEGATLREVLRFNTVERAVMVDIDEEVVRVAREHLGEWHMGALDDPRAEIVIMDGLKYVEDAREKFDVIIADLADPLEAGPAYKLYTREFYGVVKSRLNPGGVFVTQATSPTVTGYTHAVIYNTVKSVFNYAAAYHVYVRSFEGLWGFVIASDARDPASLTPEEVDGYLSRNVSGSNRFYEGAIHKSMFTIPRHLREAMGKVRDVATMDNPVFTPA